MKTLWCIPLLLASITFLSANDTITIDQQITAMQKATPQERVKLMNQFKQHLASMNAEERSKSITQLREKMQQQNTQHTAKETRTNAQHDQMQQSQQLQQMEQMQQRHGGEQYMNEMKQDAGKVGNNLPHKPQQ